MIRRKEEECGEDLFAKRSLPAPLPKNSYVTLALYLPLLQRKIQSERAKQFLEEKP